MWRYCPALSLVDLCSSLRRHARYRYMPKDTFARSMRRSYPGYCLLVQRFC